MKSAGTNEWFGQKHDSLFDSIILTKWGFKLCYSVYAIHTKVTLYLSVNHGKNGEERSSVFNLLNVFPTESI